MQAGCGGEIASYYRGYLVLPEVIARAVWFYHRFEAKALMTAPVVSIDRFVCASRFRIESGVFLSFSCRGRSMQNGTLPILHPAIVK